jgi:hypothetical protein
MSFGPHPNAFSMIAGQRHADLQAQVGHLRLVQRARTTTDRRQPRLGRHALRAAVTVLTLLAAFQRS